MLDVYTMSNCFEVDTPVPATSHGRNSLHTSNWYTISAAQMGKGTLMAKMDNEE